MLLPRRPSEPIPLGGQDHDRIQPDDRSAGAARPPVPRRGATAGIAEMPPSMLIRQAAELRRVLAQVLDVVADYEDTEIDERTQILDSGERRASRPPMCSPSMPPWTTRSPGARTTTTATTARSKQAGLCETHAARLGRVPAYRALERRAGDRGGAVINFRRFRPQRQDRQRQRSGCCRERDSPRAPPGRPGRHQHPCGCRVARVLRQIVPGPLSLGCRHLGCCMGSGQPGGLSRSMCSSPWASWPCSLRWPTGGGRDPVSQHGS